MRAAIYARYSSDRQSDSSLVDQIRLCRVVAAREGWSEVDVFEDAAISGANPNRPGYKALLEATQAGRINVIIAESLDRLSRDLEEVARLYKVMNFLDVTLMTVSEGEISELHVGLRGTMGALYLKDLAQKTHRGLEGRARAGKSAGGIAYGYEVVRGVNDHGNPITGERRISNDQASVVREIFGYYAAGKGSRAIAKGLNARGVPGPEGRPWIDTTIRGHQKRGTGIINNELYIGRQIWNRLRYIKDPVTARRVARMNPPEDWVITEVPQLRIIDDQLWQAVKDRQAATQRRRQDQHTTNPLNTAHRPRFLLSGLITCGICGGGYTIRGKDRYGCANRANRGTCTNARTVTRQELEHRVLAGLKDRLVTPEFVAEFITGFQEEWKKIEAEQRSSALSRSRRLAEVNRRINAMVDAIEQGIITETTKSRLETLETEKAQLVAEPELPPMPALHPNLAEAYRRKVASLEGELNDPSIATEARSLIRSMIDRIDILPGPKRGNVIIELHGELATILSLTESKKNKNRTHDQRVRLSVVAGARSHLYRTSLKL